MVHSHAYMRITYNKVQNYKIPFNPTNISTKKYTGGSLHTYGAREPTCNGIRSIYDVYSNSLKSSTFFSGSLMFIDVEPANSCVSMDADFISGFE